MPVRLTYAAIMLLAMLTAWWLARQQPRPALPPYVRLALGLGGFVGAMLGAKLPFFISDLITHAGDSGRGAAWLWMSDGKTIMAGLVGGYAGIELVKWALQVRVKTGDGFAVPVAAAIAIGRWGCFVAGCCYGTPTTLPWGVRFHDGLLRHPTQIYESLFHAACAVVLACLIRLGWFRGQLIKLYFLAYFAYRFVTEFVRPEPRYWLHLTAYQWAALFFSGVFIILLIYDRPQGREYVTPA